MNEKIKKIVKQKGERTWEWLKKRKPLGSMVIIFYRVLGIKTYNSEVLCKLCYTTMEESVSDVAWFS